MTSEESVVSEGVEKKSMCVLRVKLQFISSPLFTFWQYSNKRSYHAIFLALCLIVTYINKFNLLLCSVAGRYKLFFEAQLSNESHTKAVKMKSHQTPFKFRGCSNVSDTAVTNLLNVPQNRSVVSFRS